MIIVNTFNQYPSRWDLTLPTIIRVKTEDWRKLNEAKTWEGGASPSSKLINNPYMVCPVLSCKQEKPAGWPILFGLFTRL